VIAAHPSPDRAPKEAVKRFLAELSEYVRVFDSEESRQGNGLEFIKQAFGYPEDDIKVCVHALAFPSTPRSSDRFWRVHTGMAQDGAVPTGMRSGF
jgi:hypothetical protein